MAWGNGPRRPKPRRPKFRRRRFQPLLSLYRLFVFLAVCWGAGLVVFAFWVWASHPPEPMPHADGIVALTGGDDRVGAALALLAAHDAPVLLISGAGRGTYLGDFTPDDQQAATQYAAAITLGHMAATTHENAVETADWVAAHGIHTLIVVTADYHMPRALLELGHALPSVTLIAAPVRPPAMTVPQRWSTVKLLAGEYSKYLVVRFGLGDAAAALTGPP
jgi:uncharacterized SAM-binding protein YcdF (DUF218 family)